MNTRVQLQNRQKEYTSVKEFDMLLHSECGERERSALKPLPMDEAAGSLTAATKFHVLTHNFTIPCHGE